MRELFKWVAVACGLWWLFDGCHALFAGRPEAAVRFFLGAFGWVYVRGFVAADLFDERLPGDKGVGAWH